MKKLLTVAAIALIGCFATSEAQAQRTYKLGSTVAKTLTTADTMEVSVNGGESIVLANVTLADTNKCDLALSTSSTGLVVGAQVIFKVRASDTKSKDTLTFGYGFTAPTLVVDTLKTKTATFVYDGTGFIGLGQFETTE